MNNLLKIGGAAVLAIGAAGGYLYYKGGLNKFFGELDNTKNEKVTNRNNNKNGQSHLAEQKSKPMDMAGSKRIPADHPLVNQAFQNGNR